MAKCKYKTELRPEYECPEEALPNSKEGYCIFHEPRKDKDIKKFNAGIEDKLEKKDYDFTGYYFPDEAAFGNQKFEGRTSFISAVFERCAYFEKAEFQDDASFDRAHFEEDAVFENCKFKQRARFERTNFSTEAWFRGASFQGTTSFDGGEFGGRGWFVGAKFNNRTSFQRAIFEGVGLFRGAEFGKIAFFDYAEFGDQARFDEAVFYGDARFENAEFTKEAHFRSKEKPAQFCGAVYFNNAKFAKPTWFDGVKFFENAQFAKVIFQDLAYFRSTQFCKDKVAEFYGSQFKERAFFEAAQFCGETIFLTAEFDKTVSFRDAKFARDSDAEVAYRKAKISYQQEGDYTEAGYYYLKEMRARRKSMTEIRWAWLNQGLNYLEEKAQRTIPIIGDNLLQLQTKITRGNSVVKKLLKKLDVGIFLNKTLNCNQILFRKLRRSLVLIGRAGHFTIDLISGYGEQPWKVILTALVIIGIFSSVYLASGAIVFQEGSEVMRLRGPLDALYFSVVTFTTLGYGDWHPDPNHWIRYFAMAEAFTGAFMMALFVLCFARKWMR